MTEDELDARDATGAPLLECVVVGLASLELIAVTVAAWWLW
jgi:hypothetical protein